MQAGPASIRAKPAVINLETDMTLLAASISQPAAATRRGLEAFLRRVLIADVVTSAAAGLLMLAGGGFLESLLGLQAALLRSAGFGLLPFAAFVAYVATRETLSRGAVWAVIALNALWVADSLLLLIAGWVSPTGLGYAFVLGQAALVALLAELEYMGLRKAASA
jgi:hypothetical protein